MYYSEVSHSNVTEEEVLEQIIYLCNKWFCIAHPGGNFTKYLSNHTDLFIIDKWPDFKKVD